MGHPLSPRVHSKQLSPLVRQSVHLMQASVWISVKSAIIEGYKQRAQQVRLQ